MTRDAVTPFGSVHCSPGMRTCKFLMINVGVSVVLYVCIMAMFLRTERHEVCPLCRCATTAAPDSARLRSEERIVAAVLGAQNHTAAAAFGALLQELGLLRTSLRDLHGSANGSSARNEGIVRAILEDVRELLEASRAAKRAAAVAAAVTESPERLVQEKRDAEQQREAWSSLQRNVEHMQRLYTNFSLTVSEAVRRQLAAVTTERPHIRRDTYSMSLACRPIPKRNNSAWFKSHYNDTVTPFLTNQTATLSNDTLKWFKTMQSDRNTPEKLQALVTTLLSLLPPNAGFPRPSSKSCLRCAVVGNSGNVKDLRYGTFIDQHTFVFRMNNAPVQCFERDVGKRTTHRFVYPESFKEDIATGVGLVLMAFKSNDFLWLLNKLPNYNVSRFLLKKKVSLLDLKQTKVLVVNPTFMKYVREAWSEKHGRYPSTGFLTTLFALHVCDEVNLFGFGQDRRGSWHHYWADTYTGGAAWRKTLVHDGDYEASILARLDEEGIINIYRES
ncbi:CMP-N-acetylneuraminate-beta-galactosamide-alpha-2,3-sialyltransferase 1-like [Petromyzon marinus]|uniref:CMP-N-acetylneuraminate-beta-galactosamide-alpha-2,3-sialyltransferase 2 n=1 Tax=Petromyzon marinus TaxID=7757 RepID=A0AAJ7SX70_PETMA|nr:CMP-N-acetylneuraminate-beta-galactosamide-alpha-2,3-sialyltransferase 1-like [Petromyzon marinus]XP_032806253.1 CMP-N-acetylneuraminate-beta-galactosamide-alpha-2,3-sialyltransferase 1-like [Petromyzon marinus]